MPRKQWSEENPTMAEERVSILEPVIARTHTTFYDKKNGGVWRHEPTHLAQAQRKVDPINPAGYDPWVYQHTKDNIAPHVQWHDRGKGSQAPKQDSRYHHAFPEDVYNPEESFAQNAPEKVHVLQPKWYKERADTNKPNTRTTFYNRASLAQQDPSTLDGEAIAAAEEADRENVKADLAAKNRIGDPSEKTSILEPDAYERRQNYALPYMRTTYYAQK